MIEFKNGDKIIVKYQKHKNLTISREDDIALITTYKKAVFIRNDNMSIGTAAWIQLKGNKQQSRVLLKNIQLIEV